MSLLGRVWPSLAVIAVGVGVHLYNADPSNPQKIVLWGVDLLVGHDVAVQLQATTAIVVGIGVLSLLVSGARALSEREPAGVDE